MLSSQEPEYTLSLSTLAGSVSYATPIPPAVSYLRCTRRGRRLRRRTGQCSSRSGAPRRLAPLRMRKPQQMLMHFACTPWVRVMRRRQDSSGQSLHQSGRRAIMLCRWGPRRKTRMSQATGGRRRTLVHDLAQQKTSNSPSSSRRLRLPPTQASTMHAVRQQRFQDLRAARAVCSPVNF